MGHLFSKKKESKVTEQDKAVLQLKTTRDKIKQFQKRSDGILEKDRQLAKQLLQLNKKERAKLLLRKKRFIEEKLKQADVQLENVEKMIQDIEFAVIEMKVVDGLKVGNEALKMISDVMSIEDIEMMLDETKEAMEKQEEISAILTGISTSVDEDEVEAELEKMLQDDMARQMPEVPTGGEVDSQDIELPDVPAGEPREKVKSKAGKREQVALEAS